VNTDKNKSPGARNQRTTSTSADYWLLGGITFLVSIVALAFYYRHGAILLYGDAVAHINIARRIFDSRTPGIWQLGTVWLPLPHLLDAPFIANDWMWQTGLGAAIPSVIAYIAGILGVFRLLRGYASRATAWIGALIYALNPNLIYMQTTAMTELLYLAFFIWAVVFFCEFVRYLKIDVDRSRRSLEHCAIMVSAAMLVRYDGWFLAMAMVVAAVVAVWCAGRFDSQVRSAFVRLVLLTGLTGALWLAYNYANFYNPFEFATGPYSTRAIVHASSMPVYPGQDHPRTAAMYFLKIARLNISEGPLEYLLFNIAFTAALAAICFSRKHWPALLLWIPVPFYILSMAWASVPVYLPQWWPHSYYNVRYGLQMLPAVAVFGALAFEFFSRIVPVRVPAVIIVLAVAASYFMVWQKGPICLREAQANGRARMMFEHHLALELEKLPARASLMMECGAHGAALQEAGIPLRRVLQEGNHPEWLIGLGSPARAADYVVAFQGDQMSYAVRAFPEGLRPVAIVETPGQAKATIYRSLH
jgi:hypothetical protein